MSEQNFPNVPKGILPHDPELPAFPFDAVPPSALPAKDYTQALLEAFSMAGADAATITNVARVFTTYQRDMAQSPDQSFAFPQYQPERYNEIVRSCSAQQLSELPLVDLCQILHGIFPRLYALNIWCEQDLPMPPGIQTEIRETLNIFTTLLQDIMGLSGGLLETRSLLHFMALANHVPKDELNKIMEDKLGSILTKGILK